MPLALARGLAVYGKEEAQPPPLTVQRLSKRKVLCMIATTMSATVQNGTGRLRAVRRRGVKWVGKRLTRALDRFYASQSLVGNPPVFASEAFPFLRRLEAEWRTILAELELILAHREHIPPFHAISPDQQRISKGEQWRTFFLYGFGIRSRRNCSQCPETARLLGTIPDLRTAWFSILDPGSHIPPHHGPTKGVIVFHLPLILPAEREKCFIRVADHIHHWALNEVFAFDDTYEHEVHNATGQQRVVLIFHADRPMRWPGRTVNRAFQAVMRRSAYIQDPLRNLAHWADRFEKAAARRQAADEAGGRTGS